MICVTLNTIIDSIKRYLFWVLTSQNILVFSIKKNSTCFIFQRHELVWWDKCPGLCTCHILVATCPGQALMSSPSWGALGEPVLVYRWSTHRRDWAVTVNVYY